MTRNKTEDALMEVIKICQEVIYEEKDCECREFLAKEIVEKINKIMNK